MSIWTCLAIAAVVVYLACVVRSRIERLLSKWDKDDPWTST